MALLLPHARFGAPRVDGKFLKVSGTRFLIKGVSYGTFAPRPDDGAQFPPRARIVSDFTAMREAGINTVRVYTAPPDDVLEAAAAHDLKLMIGLPWTQHVAFLDERRLRRQIRSEVVRQVRTLHRHPASLLFAVGNEIPPGVVRWHGAETIERFLRELYDETKSAAPDALLAYVNFPPTEYLDVSCFDVCAFNVYLHDEDKLRAYLTRLQHIAGHKPLLIAEAGADSQREGISGQAALTAMQLRSAFEVGACGAVAYAWTDEWWRGGVAVDDWSFGLVDHERRAKPALAAVSQAFASAPFSVEARSQWPRVSVVVCAYNAEETIDECLTSLERLSYPDYEVVVVDDGSRDRTADIVRRHPRARLMTVANGGLSRARNIGMRAATGEIVAYLDADAHADPQWLDFLVQPMLRSAVAGSGGPNVVPADDSWMAQCVARAPGGPTHVMLTDDIAEHVPGCNMAFRREALLAIDGFNPIYLRAGDDVDLCWRVQANCGPIGFAPSALVWHHHRASIGAYWRQQVGYGEGEEWLRPAHPEKFAGRHIAWRGLVYSPLPFVRSMFARRVNAGVWGTAAFPSVYRVGRHALTYLPHAAEWQVGALLAMAIAGVLATLELPTAAHVIALAGALALLTTSAKCVRLARRSELREVPTLRGLPRSASDAVCRLTIAWLHFIQPLARLHGRMRARRDWPFEDPRPGGPRTRGIVHAVRMIVGRTFERRFWSESWVPHAGLLTRLVELLRRARLPGQIEVDDGWTTSDVSVRIAPGMALTLRSLIEEHAHGRCLLRARLVLSGRWRLFVTSALAVISVLTGLASLASPLIVALLMFVAGGFALLTTRRLADAVAGFDDAIQRLAAEGGMVEIDAAHLAPRHDRATPEARHASVEMVQETQ